MLSYNIPIEQMHSGSHEALHPPHLIYKYHYPFVSHSIAKILGPNTKILDGGAGTAADAAGVEGDAERTVVYHESVPPLHAVGGIFVLQADAAVGRADEGEIALPCLLRPHGGLIPAGDNDDGAKKGKLSAQGGQKLVHLGVKSDGAAGKKKDVAGVQKRAYLGLQIRVHRGGDGCGDCTVARKADSALPVGQKPCKFLRQAADFRIRGGCIFAVSV